MNATENSIIVAIVVAAIGSIAAFIRFLVQRWLQTSNEKIGGMEARISSIEKTYVSRADFEHAMRHIDDKLEAGFTRTHDRLDEVYKVMPKRSRDEY